MPPAQNRCGSGLATRGVEETMLDTILFISTVIFFVASVLYVKFCDGLR